MHGIAGGDKTFVLSLLDPQYVAILLAIQLRELLDSTLHELRDRVECPMILFVLLDSICSRVVFHRKVRIYFFDFAQIITNTNCLTS